MLLDKNQDVNYGVRYTFAYRSIDLVYWPFYVYTENDYSNNKPDAAEVKPWVVGKTNM